MTVMKREGVWFMIDGKRATLSVLLAKVAALPGLYEPIEPTSNLFNILSPIFFF